MNITILIVIITSVVSILSFSNINLFQKLRFSPVLVSKNKQYYRLLSYALLHGSWGHLFINMLVLWPFGSSVELYFDIIFDIKSKLYFILLYTLACIVSNFIALRKHRNNYNYSAVGASGGVAAIVFASILFEPLRNIYFFAILPIPGILFGFMYLAYSFHMDKKNKDNIAHDAHFLGAIFGFVFPIVLNPNLWYSFIEKLFSFI